MSDTEDMWEMAYASSIAGDVAETRRLMDILAIWAEQGIYGEFGARELVSFLSRDRRAERILLIKDYLQASDSDGVARGLHLLEYLDAPALNTVAGDVASAVSSVRDPSVLPQLAAILPSFYNGSNALNFAVVGLLQDALGNTNVRGEMEDAFFQPGVSYNAFVGSWLARLYINLDTKIWYESYLDIVATPGVSAADWDWYLLMHLAIAPQGARYLEDEALDVSLASDPRLSDDQKAAFVQILLDGADQQSVAGEWCAVNGGLTLIVVFHHNWPTSRDAIETWMCGSDAHPTRTDGTKQRIQDARDHMGVACP